MTPCDFRFGGPGLPVADQERLIDIIQVAYGQLDMSIDCHDLSSRLVKLDREVIPEIRMAHFEKGLRCQGAPKSFISYAVKTVKASCPRDAIPSAQQLHDRFSSHMKREHDRIIWEVRQKITPDRIGFRRDTRSIERTAALILDKNRVWGAHILDTHGVDVLQASVENHLLEVLADNKPVKYHFEVILPNAETSVDRSPTTVVEVSSSKPLSPLEKPYFAPLKRALEELNSTSCETCEQAYRDVVVFLEKVTGEDPGNQIRIVKDMAKIMGDLRENAPHKNRVIEQAMREVNE